ncbi:MAG TPA: hypothetical protein VGD12_04135 [Blastococcus sp.]
MSALTAAEVRVLDAVDEAWPVVGTAPAGVVVALAAVRTAGVRLGEPRTVAQAAFPTRLSDVCAGSDRLAAHPVRRTSTGGAFAGGALPAGHRVSDAEVLTPARAFALPTLRSCGVR